MLFIFEIKSFLLITGHGIGINFKCGVPDIDKFSSLKIYRFSFFSIIISDNSMNDIFSLVIYLSVKMIHESYSGHAIYVVERG